jgi:uncharacterized radical SAM superfamily Fe-S cluster-containing enzyme
MDTVSTLPEDSDEKYITFNRSQLKTAYKKKGITMPGFLKSLEINDAVIIRRQDKFASPCLATYAQMIAMVAENTDHADTAKELMAIADYFHEQADLAAHEGWKLPDR